MLRESHPQPCQGSLIDSDNNASKTFGVRSVSALSSSWWDPKEEYMSLPQSKFSNIKWEIELLIKLIFTSLTGLEQRGNELETFLLNSHYSLLVLPHQPVCLNCNFPHFLNKSGWIPKWILQPASPYALFPIKTNLSWWNGAGDKLQILKRYASRPCSWTRLPLGNI